MTEPTEMSFDEAMHTECDFCGEPAMRHRMTDSGGFYCLVPAHRWNSRSTRDQTQWAISVAKCNELHRSPLSKTKAVGSAIVASLRGSVSAIPDIVS